MQQIFDVKASDRYNPEPQQTGPGQQRYSPVEQIGKVDIRYYEERMAAQTQYAGPEDRASTNMAFERLSAYFRGENYLQRGLYEAGGAHHPRGTSFPLQFPWTQQFTAKGWMMRLWLPKTQNFFTAPMPKDPKISIVRLAPHAYATTRLESGFSEDAVRAAAARISGALESTDWCSVGAPELWSYAMPTSPVLADVEIAIEVANLSER